MLESTLTRQRRVVVSTPPQHGKTFTTLHGLIWLMRRRRDRRNAYVTYEATRAEDMSLQAQRIAAEAGLQYVGSRKSWRLHEGGGLVATGIGGPLTGYAVDGLLLIDDPVKNAAEAFSEVTRNAHHEWFRSVAMTRVHPGASVILIQTRWHHDDLAGRQIAAGWERINLPALNDAGDPLWPEMWPREYLEAQRAEVGEYVWASLYQGEPRPRGGAVFRDPHFYTDLPTAADGSPPIVLRLSIGADFAYTKKTYADYSVAVVMAEHAGIYYVLDVVRAQLEAPAFAEKLGPLQKEHGVKVHAYIGGTEKGVIQFLKERGVRMQDSPAIADKFSRAQPVAAAWNAGKVLLPMNAPFNSTLIGELAEFTGVSDRHDDQVDALAAAFDALARPQPPRGVVERPVFAF